MLVIARRIGEAIQIGPDIEVKILSASPSRVMVAIAAPRSLKILRVPADEKVKAQGSGPESAMRAANETIRQRRLKLTSG